MRNPIRERDDRIAVLEAEVASLKAQLAQVQSDSESGAEWLFTDGRGELDLSDGWKATVCSHAGTYAWSVHNAKTAEYGVGTASSWSEARRQALEAVKR
jgi:hypothetical protein